MLSHDVQAYLTVRRAMGFAMKWSGNLLRSFAAFSDTQGQHNIRSEYSNQVGCIRSIRPDASTTARFSDSIGKISARRESAS